jgi:hypothetical protein
MRGTVQSGSSLYSKGRIENRRGIVNIVLGKGQAGNCDAGLCSPGE